MSHPDLKKSELATFEAAAVQSVVTILRHFGPRALAEFGRGFPEITGPPGLRVLVAPDGVTVSVLRGDETPDEVRRLVMTDEVRRYFRPEAEAMLAAGSSTEEIDVAAYRTLSRVKGQYKIELLGDSGPGTEGESRG